MKKNWKNENAEHFEAHALEKLLPLYPWLVKDIETMIARSVAGLNVLEIGCGPGFMLEALLAAGVTSLTGVDLSHSMLHAAASSGRSKESLLVQADVTNLPLQKAKFDIIFSRGSLFFWPDLATAFTWVASCLKPGGTAMLGGGYGMTTPQELVDKIREGHDEHHGKGIPRVDLEHLSELARNIGGEVRIESAPRRGFWLVWTPRPSNKK